MYIIEVPKPIRSIIATYHYLGIWKSKEKIEYNEWRRKSFYFITLMMFSIFLAIGGFQSDIIQQKIFLVSLAIQISVVAIKMLYVLSRKSDISRFISNMGVHTIEDREEFLLVNAKLNKLLILLRLYVGGIFGSSLLAIVFPLITKTLLLNISFPFKKTEIGFWVAYAYEIINSLLCMIPSLLTTIIWFLMMSSSIKYQILGSQFRNCGLPTTKTTVGLRLEPQEIFPVCTEQKIFIQDLIAFIQTHRYIQKKVGQFMLCFSNLFMIQLVTSAACICGSIYVLAFSNSENWIQASYNIVFLIYNVFDIFMILYLGNEIKLKSGGLSYCLFQSNWIGQSKRTKQIMTILMEVLKRPDELVILKLYPMDLKTFTSILNLTYSMFNILQNFK